ncbi:hypothetical protein PM020_17190 [Halorubrum ezzemoulense]|nr:hypothetical protein [Halorubrum ezzemoulense]
MSRNEFAEVIELGSLSAQNAGQLIQSYADIHDHDLTDEKAQTLAEKVGRDPHLIGLLGQLMYGRDTIDDLPDTSKEVLKQYSEDAYETAAKASNKSLIVPDFEKAVEELSLGVLEKRNLVPTWREVCELSWSISDYLDGVRNLSSQGQLFSILKQRNERRLSFRHDRIRDFLLAESSLNKIKRSNVIPDYLTDPYYYSIVGTGIAYFRPSKAVLSELRDNNPVALLESLRRLGGDAPNYEQKVGTEFRQWLDNQGEYSDIPDSVLAEIANILYQTESEEVLKIAELLPPLPRFLLARFRNGDLEAGIQYCTGGMGGNPNINHPQRDSVFADAIQRYGDGYTSALSEFLPEADAKQAQGALRLAGYLGRSELGSGLRSCWENHGDNLELLPAFLWATFRCCIPEHRSLVDQVVKKWESLPSGSSYNDESIDVGSGNVYTEIKHSLVRNVSESQIQYLIDAADDFTGVGHYITSLLSQLPDPDGLELVVKKRGKNIRETDGSSIWATNLLDNWDPNHHRGQTLPSESKKRMEKVWRDDEKIDEVRTSAFTLWSQNAQEKDLDALRHASKNDLFEYNAFRRRLQLGDSTAITSIPQKYIGHGRLLKPVSNAWGPEAFELVDRLLNENSPDDRENLFYNLGKLLFRVPRNDAESLLNDHWEKVKTHPNFFQAALYTATPTTEELAGATYDDSDDPEGLLEHVRMNFGFNTYGRSQLITERHLYALERYLSDIREIDVMYIVEKANNLGMKDWAENHAQSHLSDSRRQKHFPTDSDLLNEFREILDNDDKTIRGWMIRFEDRSVSKSQVFKVLEEWLQSDPTVEAYRISAELIKNWGTREELKILDDVRIEEKRIQPLYKNAEFGVKIRTLN